MLRLTYLSTKDEQTLKILTLINNRIMELKDVKTLNDIQQGDTLIITGGLLKNEPVKAQIVNVSPIDGTEIIIDKKGNRFFNLGMYLEGKSWVKEVKVIV